MLHSCPPSKLQLSLHRFQFLQLTVLPQKYGIIAKLQLSKREGVKATKNSGDMCKSNTELVELVPEEKEFISNPPVKKKQSQSRKQPHAIGAPTTSSYKAASNRSNRERMETERVKAAKALGTIIRCKFDPSFNFFVM